MQQRHFRGDKDDTFVEQACNFLRGQREHAPFHYGLHTTPDSELNGVAVQRRQQKRTDLTARILAEVPRANRSDIATLLQSRRLP